MGDDIREVRYLTDDRDYKDRRELVISFGGNGDWYVSVVQEGAAATTGVRLCTSGGASSKAPGLTAAIANAFRAITEADASEGSGIKVVRL